MEQAENKTYQLPRPLPDWTDTRFGGFAFTVSKYVIIGICVLAGVLFLPMFIRATGRSIVACKDLESAIIL